METDGAEPAVQHIWNVSEGDHCTVNGLSEDTSYRYLEILWSSIKFNFKHFWVCAHSYFLFEYLNSSFKPIRL